MTRKKKRIPKLLAPVAAAWIEAVYALHTDNADVGSGWIIITENQVTLRNQKLGEESTGSVTFTKHEFARLARWYLRPQRTRSR